ncbi:MAG: tRNA epoxyqueuosine(34) reductase QueG [Phycisphaerales bacterium]|nr:tRNA epoxyqueuosine(34) reductase QueG [Phycisphaerales bacterium]
MLKSIGARLGFDLVGATPAEPLERATYYRQWLAAGHHGEMSYLARNAELRNDPKSLLPGARSIISVAMNYFREDEGDQAHVGEETGRVARYARGRDYHIVLRERLTSLAEQLREAFNEPFESRVCVDTAPLLEREVARLAGIGWIGKNTCVLNNKLGSYLFLGELLITLEFAPDSPMPDHCGSCTRCLDACPTQAFAGPYKLDARRCISYWTIEHRGDVPEPDARGIGDWLFGCDICQEVCPFNTRAPITPHAEFRETLVPARIPLAKVIDLRSSAWKRMTLASAAGRATRRMWQRNAAIVAANLRGTRGTGGRDA